VLVASKEKPIPSKDFGFETSVMQYTQFKLFFVGFELMLQTLSNFVQLKNFVSLIKEMCVRNTRLIFV
jgi:hypothetical protein